jgi:hypothetical protein
MFPSRPCDVDTSRVFANHCLKSLFSWYISAIASCACFSCYEGSRTSVLSMFVLILLPQLSRLVPSMGSNQIVHMSNSSVTDFARGSLGTRVSLTSLFFLVLPLLQGIGCWGDRASNSFLPPQPFLLQPLCGVMLPFPQVEGNIPLDPWGSLLQVEMTLNYFCCRKISLQIGRFPLER